MPVGNCSTSTSALAGLAVIATVTPSDRAVASPTAASDGKRSASPAAWAATRNGATQSAPLGDVTTIQSN